jgi:hypothetical protein
MQRSTFSPCGRRWPREARSDEGCWTEYGSSQLRLLCPRGKARNWGIKRDFALKSIASLLASIILLALPAPALAAQNQDPDWPCIQRKVPELSLGQIWSGPELPASAADWSKDDTIETLVRELAARRVPIAEAEQEIRDFAAALPKDKARDQLAKLFLGLFDHMNGERAQVMSGIGRYAHSQVLMADRLRKEGSEVDALRAKPDADPDEIARKTDRLVFETRIFDERVQSLTYVCEVPTLIEQRLYALAKVVAEEMKKGQ